MLYNAITTCSGERALQNTDSSTVESFGAEWTAFRQSDQELGDRDRMAVFDGYFHLFPWDALPANARGADIGCGSGRWAAVVAPKIAQLYAIDPSHEALSVARINRKPFPNVMIVQGDANDLPTSAASLDFAYCLGVLHHVPDTESALRAIRGKLKPGAPFLLYLYYAFDNRPAWYRLLWRLSNSGRMVIPYLPRRLQRWAANAIAATVYWPLARAARALEKMGALPLSWPLSFYRDKAFYVLRTDAYDRFCTPLEKRFSKEQIDAMLQRAGFERIQFSATEPFWVALAFAK